MGTEDEILLAADGGHDLLDRDDIPNENQSLTCFACDTPMAGLYCHECGNKNDNYRRSVFTLAVDLFQNLTAMDGRMWRSVRSLILRPGRMSRDFADGARSRWTSPVRFYIAASIMLFGYITLSQTQIIAVGSIQNSDSTIAQVSIGEARFNPRPHFFIRKDQLTTDFDEDTQQYLRGFTDGLISPDSIEELEEGIAELDRQIADAGSDAERIALSEARDNAQTTLEARRGTRDISDPDSGSDEGSPSSESGSLNFVGPGGREVSLDREGLQVLIELMMERPELFNEQVNDMLNLSLFFMLPLAMILGAVFIRGRDTALLYDHLVHAAYIHAFSFLLLLLFILLHQYTPLEWLVIPYTVILLVYLPLSAKGMFRRGWFKSVLTAYGVGAVYSLVMLVIFAVVVFSAINNVAADLTDQRERFSAGTGAGAEVAAPVTISPPTEN